MSPTEAAVLNGALNLGVTLVDTALSYGASEERIGRHLGHRRQEFVLSSKGGSGVAGHEDWMAGALAYCDPFWALDCVGLR